MRRTALGRELLRTRCFLTTGGYTAISLRFTQCFSSVSHKNLPPAFGGIKMDGTSQDATYLSVFPDFALPGNTTTDFQYRIDPNGPTKVYNVAESVQFPRVPSDAELLDIVSSSKTPQTNDIFNRIANQEALRQLECLANAPNAANHQVECAVFECPNLIRKDFADLFPDVDIGKCPLTVMTLTQKTENDMTAWNNKVQVERDQLTLQFITAAEAICSTLRTAGFWADFIEPASGRPYMGAFTNATLFETDDRYRNFGFSIEDLGCCKVMMHGKWGSYSFVGSIFCSAPLDSEILQSVMLCQQNDSMPTEFKKQMD